ncbi:MAG: nuclear transport factor 2 family protein [Polyangiaceae bacterium]
MNPTTWRVFAVLAIATAAGATSGCAPRLVTPVPARPVPDHERTIRDMLDDFHAAAAEADERRYFDHLSEASVFLGTDGTERWSKAEFRAYAHPHFAKGKAWTMHAKVRHVTVHPGGSFAWFDEDLETAKLGPCRGSGVAVFDAKDNRWRLEQYNLTLVIPNEKLDAVRALVTGADARSTSRAPSLPTTSSKP